MAEINLQADLQAIRPDNIQINIDNKLCIDCGKKFRTPADLLKHKNRKTPCLIKELTPDHINNPNRCVHCNKIFSKKENLTRHLGVCKIKNIGADIVNVGYEEEIRLMKEKDRQKDEKIKDIEEKYNTILAEINTLKATINDIKI